MKTVAIIFLFFSFSNSTSVFMLKTERIVTQYTFIIVDSQSAKILKFNNFKGDPLLETIEILNKIDSNRYSIKDKYIEFFKHDSTKINLFEGNKSVELTIAKIEEFNNISNRAFFSEQRMKMVKILKGGLGFAENAGIYYDKRAKKFGILNSFENSSDLFRSMLKDFHHSIIDSILTKS